MTSLPQAMLPPPSSKISHPPAALFTYCFVPTAVLLSYVGAFCCPMFPSTGLRPCSPEDSLYLLQGKEHAHSQHVIIFSGIGRYEGAPGEQPIVRSFTMWTSWCLTGQLWDPEGVILPF